MLYLAQICFEARDECPLAGFVGLSGVYNISRHYSFESTRGVHEASPMKAANGDVEGFDMHSPELIIEQLRCSNEHTWRPALPHILLLHGDNDDVVPPRESIEMHAQLVKSGHTNAEAFSTPSTNVTALDLV